MDVPAVVGLKVFAGQCSERALSMVRHGSDLEIIQGGTECAYPPYYRMMWKGAAPKRLIVAASDVRSKGRSRFIMFMTIDMARSMAYPNNRSAAPSNGNFTPADARAVSTVVDKCIDGYISPMQSLLGTELSHTPSVMIAERLEEGSTMTHFSKLITGYDIMVETRIIGRKGETRGGMVFLPDKHLQRDLLSHFERDVE